MGSYEDETTLGTSYAVDATIHSEQTLFCS